MVQDWLSQAGVRLSSADTLENQEDSFRFNTEYLNTLRPNGFPQHSLKLKPGMPAHVKHQPKGRSLQWDTSGV